MAALRLLNALASSRVSRRPAPRLRGCLEIRGRLETAPTKGTKSPFGDWIPACEGRLRALRCCDFNRLFYQLSD